jgi:hypothetical protein
MPSIGNAARNTGLNAARTSGLASAVLRNSGCVRE